MAQEGYCVFVDRVKFEEQDIFDLENEEESTSSSAIVIISKKSELNSRFTSRGVVVGKEIKPKSTVAFFDFESYVQLAEGIVLAADLDTLKVLFRSPYSVVKKLFSKNPRHLALVAQSSRITKDRVEFLLQNVFPRTIANKNGLFWKLTAFLDGHERQSSSRDQLSGSRHLNRFQDPSWDAYRKLNISQQKAVQGALECDDFYLIHGPPGTGKSQTLVVILEALFLGGKNVLVCAESHNPIDNLLSKFVKDCKPFNQLPASERRARLVRLGASWLVDGKSQEYLIENRVKDLDKCRKPHGDQSKQRMKDPSRRDDEKKLKVLKDAQFVFGTKCGLFNKLLRDYYSIEENKFDYVVVDEASQSFLAFTLMAVMCAKKIIFAGDHLQLPPTITNHSVKDRLEVSLFERLINRQKDCKPQKPVYTMLDTQYRMNEHLMRFSNHYYYDGRVKTGDRNKNILLKDIVSPRKVSTIPLDLPILWIQNDEYEQSQNNKNITNTKEAQIIFDLIKELTRIGIKPSDIGVIVAYNSQRALITEKICRDPDMKTVRLNVDELVVATVDSFQGREKEVIIFATSRSNRSSSIGFLKDARRLNVAATRAKRQFIIVGNKYTLINDKSHFEGLYRLASKHSASF